MTGVESVSIIIPVYQEARTVEVLLERVFRQQLPDGLRKEMIIVESNSPDGSREIVTRFAESANRRAPGSVVVVLQERARGKGSAMRQGLAAATGDIVLIQDADLEYDMNDYAGLLEPVLDGRAEVVLGSRHMAAGTWKIRKFETRWLRSFVFNFAGVFFHGYFNLLFHQELTDPTTMFKVFRRDCVEGVRFRCNMFDFDLELIGTLCRLGYMPLEVPVSYTSRTVEEGKKIRLVRDGFLGMWAMTRCRFLTRSVSRASSLAGDASERGRRTKAATRNS